MSRPTPFAPEAPSLADELGIHPEEISRDRNAYTTKSGKPISVPTTWEEARDAIPFRFVERVLRRRIRPEWFKGTDPRLHGDHGIPPHVQAAFDRAMARTQHVAGSREALFLWFCPLYKRIGVWQDLGTGKAEAIFYITMPAAPGTLPHDLQGPEWEHLRKLGFGEFKMPTFSDFAFLMDLWHREKSVEEIEGWFHAYEKEVEAEGERVIRDRERDVLDYYGLAVHRFDFNHGRRSYQTHSEPLPESERKIVTTEIQRNGYTIKVPVGSKHEEELIAEEQALRRATSFEKLEEGEARLRARERAEAKTAKVGGRL